jgi:GTP-binding protein Era
MSEIPHKAGFVSIIGKPNVGKSTLMNVLVGENLSIITSKAQTTRHRIQGIINNDNYQIVYSDTPGIMKPVYELHKSMMRFVSTSLEDADVILFVADLFEKYDEEDVIDRINKSDVPVIFLLNKIDLAKSQEQVEEKLAEWKDRINPKDTLVISALKEENTAGLLELVLSYLPEHPAYFPKDEMTDKTERFFVSEMIREQIFKNYKKEVPYSCEVRISEFKEDERIIRIRAEILVERESQKGIIIGHKGQMLKKVGSAARFMMERFFDKQVFLEQHVKVEKDWRKKSDKLKSLGYSD